MPTDPEEQVMKFAIEEFKKEDKEYGQAFEKLYNTRKAFEKIGFVLSTQEEIKDALDKTKKYRVAILAFMNLTKKKQKNEQTEGIKYYDPIAKALKKLEDGLQNYLDNRTGIIAGSSLSVGAGLAGGVFGILKSQKIIKLAKTSTIAIIATLAVICAVGTAIAIYNKVQQQKNKKSVENTAEKINQININLLEAVMKANQNY